ncbi:MAG: Na+/H+ antiporter [Actinomycetota bacterium]|nr:MAG: Na+/H+ antiporter [Actinomycetota bacterium]
MAVVVLAAAVLVGGLSRRYGLPAPLVLVGTGLVVTLVPAVPEVPLEPDLVLFLVLPPLLFSAALSSSYVSLRADLRPILSLSVGLVVVGCVVVGAVLHLLVPGIPLPVAFAFGAIVAPTDAVAATAVGRSLGLPRRTLTILEGESLLNDATALTLYKVAVGVAIGSAASVAQDIGIFVAASVGGVALGLLLGFFMHGVLRRIDDPLLESATALVVPFVAYSLGEELHTSGVLAVVVCGLYVAHRGYRDISFSGRLQLESMWRLIAFVLECLVFLLIGLQFQTTLAEMAEVDVGHAFALCAAMLGTVIVVRIGYVFGWAWLSRLVGRRRSQFDGPRQLTVVSWAGMRGVVSLAAAFGLPQLMADGVRLPYRELVTVLTFFVVIGTLALQGLTLPLLIRRLGLGRSDTAARRRLQAAAVETGVRAGLARLDELVARGEPAAVPDVVARLRGDAESRAATTWEMVDVDAPGLVPAAAYRSLRRDMIAAERDAVRQLRDDGTIDDDMLRDVWRDLDLEEELLSRQ